MKSRILFFPAVAAALSFLSSIPLGYASESRELGCQNNSRSFSSLLESSRILQPVVNQISCNLFEGPICGEASRAMLWAQHRLGADLAHKEYPELKDSQDFNVKVAVLDTGFDLTGDKRFGPVTTQKAADWVGNPNEDEEGHGTAVSGLINGKEGVGLIPGASLTSFRVDTKKQQLENGWTVKYSPDNHDRNFLMTAAKLACDSGHEVINISWGSYYDETGQRPNEKIYKETLDYLNSKGCIVVTSAGNGGYEFARADLDSDDSYLRVGGSNYYGFDATFASKGEVSAPSSSVFTFFSSKSDSRRSCMKEDAGFISGTSFSSPLTSATAAAILNRIKRNKKVYGSMSGSDRVSLINRILIASQVNGSINVYRALKLIDAWLKTIHTDADANPEQAHAIPSTKELSEILHQENQAFCKTKIQCADTEQECPEQKTCFNRLRRKFALCGSQESESEAYQAAHLLEKNGWIGDALYYAKSLPPAKKNALQLVKNLHESKNDQFLADQEEFESSQLFLARDTLAGKLEKSLSPEQAERTVSQTLESAWLLRSLSKSWVKGEKGREIEAVMTILKEYEKNFGEDRLKNQLSFLSPDKTSNPLGAYRILLELAKDCREGRETLESRSCQEVRSLVSQYISALNHDPKLKHLVPESFDLFVSLAGEEYQKDLVTGFEQAQKSGDFSQLGAAGIILLAAPSTVSFMHLLNNRQEIREEYENNALQVNAKGYREFLLAIVKNSSNNTWDHSTAKRLASLVAAQMESAHGMLDFPSRWSERDALKNDLHKALQEADPVTITAFIPARLRTIYSSGSNNPEDFMPRDTVGKLSRIALEKMVSAPPKKDSAVEDLETLLELTQAYLNTQPGPANDEEAQAHRNLMKQALAFYKTSLSRAPASFGASTISPYADNQLQRLQDEVERSDK